VTRRFVVCLGSVACLFVASLVSHVYAQQARTAKDGVYTAAQAGRGETVYQKMCAPCHGAALEGQAGPPLAGAAFLGDFAARPLSDLFDKIHNTMPADAPGTIDPPQVADVVAYLLRANQLPAGGVELAAGGASLDAITMAPSTAPVPPPVAGRVAVFPPVGSLNQVMRGILFPSSNVLFDVQTRDPGAGSKGGVARGDAATTSSRYGDVYSPWMIVDAAAISIAEAGPLLTAAGRRCENGKPVPVDRADWQQYVRGLVEAGRAAYRASQSRNQEAVSDVTNQISDACANCHRVYRDVASAALRCTPPQ
jgi:mono/diheme cytochrome c family protein